jgi:2-haloacid dehalogenase
MSKPRPIIVCDVNGTLLDINIVEPLLHEIFGKAYTIDEWFHQLIQYSMAVTLAGSYRNFGDLALAVLSMAAAARGILVTDRQTENIQRALTELPPHNDAREMLSRLRNAGVRLFALSNSSAAGLKQQLRYADLAQFFEGQLSVEAVRRFKPAPEPYRMMASVAGVACEDIIMVACHCWDLIGAHAVGCRTAFVRRTGKALLPGMPQPDFVVENLTQLSEALLALYSSD